MRLCMYAYVYDYIDIHVCAYDSIYMYATMS